MSQFNLLRGSTDGANSERSCSSHEHMAAFRIRHWVLGALGAALAVTVTEAVLEQGARHTGKQCTVSPEDGQSEKNRDGKNIQFHNSSG